MPYLFIFSISYWPVVPVKAIRIFWLPRGAGKGKGLGLEMGLET